MLTAPFLPEWCCFLFADLAAVIGILCGIKLCIDAAGLQKFFVTAALGDHAISNGHDAVCCPDGRQAVGNNQCSSAICQGINLIKCIIGGVLVKQGGWIRTIVE